MKNHPGKMLTGAIFRMVFLSILSVFGRQTVTGKRGNRCRSNGAVLLLLPMLPLSQEYLRLRFLTSQFSIPPKRMTAPAVMRTFLAAS